MASFDIWQQVFSISLLSNAASNQTGTVAELETVLTNKIRQAFADWEPSIGAWDIAWGPAVYQAPGDKYADNAIFVAVERAVENPVRIVSIAATNPNSNYDWLQQDFDVENVVRWTEAFSALAPYGAPSGINPYLSAGTGLGINNLLPLQSGGATLLQFLSAVENTSETLIFAGHSLAGALSPTLALALFNPEGGKLDLSKWGNVRVYPSAGATPGNQDFATFFNGVFAPVAATPGAPPYQSWNQDVCNNLDVVPHAWQIDTLAALPTLYGDVPLLTLAELIVIDGGLIGLSEAGAFTAGPYSRLSTNPLLGTLNPSLPVTTVASYLAQASYQHVTEYEVLLGVQSLEGLLETAAPLAAVPRRLFTRPPQTRANRRPASRINRPGPRRRR
jgi:hypothetical protein